MDDLQAKLDSIQEQHAQLLSKTPADHHDEKVADAFEAWQSLRSELDQTPYRVKQAEKQYYLVKYGKDGYRDHLKASAEKQTHTIQLQFMEAHTNLMNTINAHLEQLDTVKTYLTTLATSESIQCKNITNTLDQIHMADTQTNLRKMHFLAMERSTLKHWCLLANLFLTLYAITYLGIHRDTIKEPTTFALPAVVLLFVFAFSYVVSYAFAIPKAVNSYTQWGYDPAESKVWWYVFIPLGMAILWGIIYYLEP